MFKKKYLAVAGLMAPCSRDFRLWKEEFRRFRSTGYPYTDTGDSCYSYPYTGADKYGRNH